jgi:hypothetical protein
MQNERGEVRISSLITLVILAAAALAAWNVVPVYYANYAFSDTMVELARRPKYNNSDADIMKQLEKKARELKLEDYINVRTCKIQTMDYRRKINCDYDREQQVIPGWTKKFEFRNEADQPVL